MGGAGAAGSGLVRRFQPLGRGACPPGLRRHRHHPSICEPLRAGTVRRTAALRRPGPARAQRLVEGRSAGPGGDARLGQRAASPPAAARGLGQPGSSGAPPGLPGPGPADPAADRSERQPPPCHGGPAARPAGTGAGVKRVLVTLPLPAAGTDLLRQRFEVEVVEAEGMPAPELERLVHDFDPDGIVGMVNVPISDAVMEAAPRLRCIANYAVGYNNIDLEAAVRRGILVTNTPGVLTEATADLAFALLLAIARRVSESDRFLREGRFQGWKADLLLGSDVYGRTLGIIGFGRIGQAVARRARGFEMTVLYTDARRAEAGIEAELRASFVSLDDLLRQADFVTIHADLNAQTRHLIGE